MKFYPRGEFLIEEAGRYKSITWKLFDLDVPDTFTIAQMKSQIRDSIFDTSYDFVKEELEIRGVKTLPSDNAEVKNYKFFTYRIFARKKD